MSTMQMDMSLSPEVMEAAYSNQRQATAWGVKCHPDGTELTLCPTRVDYGETFYSLDDGTTKVDKWEYWNFDYISPSTGEVSSFTGFTPTNALHIALQYDNFESGKTAKWRARTSAALARDLEQLSEMDEWAPYAEVIQVNIDNYLKGYGPYNLVNVLNVLPTLSPIRALRGDIWVWDQLDKCDPDKHVSHQGTVEEIGKIMDDVPDGKTRYTYELRRKGNPSIFINVFKEVADMFTDPKVPFLVCEHAYNFLPLQSITIMKGEPYWDDHHKVQTVASCRWFTKNQCHIMLSGDNITSLFHELAHVSQYVAGRLEQLGGNDRSWYGNTTHNNKPYRELPWEIEARHIAQECVDSFAICPDSETGYAVAHPIYVNRCVFVKENRPGESFTREYTVKRSGITL